MIEAPPTRRPVLVACEAAASTGLGHFVRSLALATELARHGAAVTVLLRPDALAGPREEVRRAGLALAVGSWDSLPQQARTSGADVVVDSYLVDGAWLNDLHEGLRNTGRRLVVIDDLADRDFTADLVVNQNLGAERLAYRGAGRVLAGPQHALLRAAFPSGRAAGLATAAGLPDVPRRVLVLFGGTDAAGMSGIAGRAALGAFPGAVVRVVTPAGPPAGTRPGADPRISYLAVSRDIHTEMLAADLVVTAGGTTLWELCCLARPAAVVAVADNQVPTYDEMTGGGFALAAGREPERSADVLAERLAGLVRPPGTLRRIALAAAALTDGTGTAQVARMLTA